MPYVIDVGDWDRLAPAVPAGGHSRRLTPESPGMVDRAGAAQLAPHRGRLR
ncbi:hypothetical protein SALB1_0413 [Salinisphaera sp. LB1]|nr:hypothetical protein SALB1_0413 [Salinisphaera sp. LB1]